MSRLKKALAERVPCSKLECDLHALCLELERDLKEINSRPVSGEPELQQPKEERGLFVKLNWR